MCLTNLTLTMAGVNVMQPKQNISCFINTVSDLYNTFTGVRSHCFKLNRFLSAAKIFMLSIHKELSQ